MDFQEKLLASHIAFEEEIDLADPIHQVRIDSLETFEAKGFPTRKDEDWKYTSLNTCLLYTSDAADE